VNALFPVNLATDIICDRYLEDEVFGEAMNRTALVLVGASHLRNLARFLETPELQIFDLTTPGWKISESNVTSKTAEIASLGDQISLENATIVLQLYDNSVFMVGGAGGTKSLPVRDDCGRYHINGELVVADKAGIKDLTSKLVPLIRALKGARKLFLALLSRYWLNPCCGDPDHLVNYRTEGFLPRLGAATGVLKDYIRDSLYTRHTSNFRVICPSKILGIGQRSSELPMDEARELAAEWGNDPVHPSGAAYEKIAAGILKDIGNADSRYTNPPRTANSLPKKPRLDLSLERDTWVRGCTATLPRRDTMRSMIKCPSVSSGSARGGNRRGRGGRGQHFRGGRFLRARRGN
jgi:hypothetical protein